ncbi:MAG: hypothetical protein KC593_17200 [Myxococcales bacterium]|nr:hypothetical protein [Myxococcales bacterium]MCB9626075.1 hypothetical protein [Sandaracinaceae bacterium]
MTKRTLTVLAFAFAASFATSPVAHAQQAPAVTLELPHATVSSPERLRTELTRLLGAPVVRPADQRATGARGTLSILLNSDGSAAHVQYRRHGYRDPILVVVRTRTPSRDGLWAAEAGAAVVRTVDEWSAEYTEVLDPWLAGHCAQSLTDPFPADGDRPVVAVEFVFVGEDIVDPWREALRAATRR